MEIVQLGQIAIVGVAASLIMKAIKSKLGTSKIGSKFAVVLVSVILGGAYYFLKDTNAWVAILGVLASASTVYAFFLKK